MSTSVVRKRATHRARQPRRRRIVLGALAAVVLVVVGLLVWWPNHGPDALTDSARVAASSTAPGFSAEAAVRPGSANPAQAGWRSAGETIGAWLEVSWPHSHAVHQITIVRNSLAEPGATEGLLTFSDGSILQVRLSTTDPTTVVPITPRTVDLVRFSIAAVSPGAQDVALSRILFSSSADDEVATDGAPGGNAAVAAAMTQSSDADTTSPRALQDGSGAAGSAGAGADWTTQRAGPTWVQLNWDRPRELSSIELVGSARPTAHVAAGTLTFDDGSTLPVGAVPGDPDRPTIVAFVPRVARSVRLNIDRVDGTGSLALAELRAYQRGATPTRSRAPATETQQGTEAPCVDTPTSDTVPIVVRCPTTASTVEGPVDLEVATAPGYTAVTATVWPADPAAPAGQPVQGTPGPTGLATLTIDTTAAPPGPFTVDVEATGDGHAAAHAYFQLYRRGALSGDVSSSPAADGRTLVYSEEFNQPVTLSRSGVGADYAAAKPDHGGAQDFGSAIFADPAQGFGNLEVVDDHYLRINVEPAPAGYVDPQNYGRTHVGGLLASSRVDGSGFAAQYGYFEARMLAPAAPGTWPAFWMLPSNNVVSPTPTVAEIDAVELYGHDPKGGCQSTHGYENGKDRGSGQCGQRQPSERAALAWHTYGVSILPIGITFYIDGRVVATAPPVAGGAAPMFFLVDLALGGGWPLRLEGVQERASLYVDYIRVYV
jgi:Glycosyl hydrolases family 16